MIVADPVLTPVTRPVALTVAIAPFDVPQVAYGAVSVVIEFVHVVVAANCYGSRRQRCWLSAVLTVRWRSGTSTSSTSPRSVLTASVDGLAVHVGEQVDGRLLHRRVRHRRPPRTCAGRTVPSPIGWCRS